MSNAITDMLVTYKLHIGNYYFSIPMGFVTFKKEKNVFKAKASNRDVTVLLKIQIINQSNNETPADSKDFESIFFDRIVNHDSLKKLECTYKEVGNVKGTLVKYLIEYAGAPMECWLFVHDSKWSNDYICIALMQSIDQKIDFFDAFVSIINSLSYKKKDVRNVQYSSNDERESTLIHNMLKYADNLSEEAYKEFLSDPNMTAKAMLAKTLIRIDGLGMEQYVCKALSNAGIVYVNNLIELTKNDVLNLDNVGPKRANLLEQRLNEVGLCFKTPEEERVAQNASRYVKLVDLGLSDEEKDFFEGEKVCCVGELSGISKQKYAKNLGKESLEILHKKLVNHGVPFCYYDTIHKALADERKRHHELIIELLEYADRNLTDEEYNNLVLRNDASVRDLLKTVSVGIYALDIGIRDYGVLYRSNITTINDLLNMSKEMLCNSNNIGEKLISRIVESLKVLDLKLKTQVEIRREYRRSQRNVEIELIKQLQNGDS